MEEQTKLVEPGVRFFLRKTLRNCREKKNIVYTRLFNIGLFLAFVSVLGGILYYKYKGKLTPAEKKARKDKEELYLTEKIKSMKVQVKRDSNMIITDLPRTDKVFR